MQDKCGSCTSYSHDKKKVYPLTRHKCSKCAAPSARGKREHASVPLFKRSSCHAARGDTSATCKGDARPWSVVTEGTMFHADAFSCASALVLGGKMRAFLSISCCLPRNSQLTCLVWRLIGVRSTRRARTDAIHD